MIEAAQRAGRGLFCSYDEGMFAPGGRQLDLAMRKDLVGVHEAGHAVVGYALGLGCSRISVEIRWSADLRTWGAIGQVRSNRRAVRRVLRQIENGAFGPGRLARAVGTAAGAAAERKFCLENGYGEEALFAPGSDHEAIDWTATRLERLAGRSRFAFRRLAWRRAQLAPENETIWRAVGILALRLGGYWPNIGDGVHCAVMPGATARAIMRREGVHPGILGFGLDGSKRLDK